MRNLEFLLALLFALYLTKVQSSTCLNTTYSNMGIYGNDLSNTLGSSSQCCSLCQDTSGCVAWTWDNTTGGTCWLKKGTQPLLTATGKSTGLMTPAANKTYSLSYHWDSTNFFNTSLWHWVTSWSLTNVTKNVNQTVAQNLGMINQNDSGKVYMGVDHTNTYPNSSRPSIQIQSLYMFNSGLFILSLDHMPEGPGTWPSWWFSGPSWPNGGEIDVLEGVDGMTENLITLHTGENCLMLNNNTDFSTGKWVPSSSKTYYDCYQYGSSNTTVQQGCSVSATNGTFQKAFNNAGGGVFALQWSQNEYLRIWNFVKPNIPADILNKSPNPNPDTWGLPQIHHPLGSLCSTNHFTNLTILFDIALCGSWVDGYYSGGEAACENVVHNHPGNFTNAYWLIDYMKVFCKPGEPCGWYDKDCLFSC